MGTSLLEMIELSLRDQILELEEKIFFGNLGKLNVSDRAEWVVAITNGGYKMDTPSLTWGDGEKLEADSQAEIELEKVQQLAAAILHCWSYKPFSPLLWGYGPCPAKTWLLAACLFSGATLTSNG